MLTRFAKITFASSLFAAALATGCTVTTSTGTDTTLTVDNEESFEIDNIWISPDSFAETDDILGGIPLQPGETITVSVECDNYDITVADPTETCEVGNYALCGGDNEFILDNTFFDTCAAGRVGTPALQPKTSATTSQR